MGTYTVQTQLRYIMQWFHEWSEMQRGDFIPFLAKKFAPSGYVNGLVSGLDGLTTSDDRPPSLFQCRIKLFRDWSEGWSQAEKEQLLTQIKSADSTFATKFEEEIQLLTAAVTESSEETVKASSPLPASDSFQVETLRIVDPDII